MVAAPAPPYVGPPRWAGSRRNKPIKRVVIHCTAGAEPGVRGAARATANYTKNTGRKSSWHYCVDARESIQLTYDSVIAYHDGTNRSSIGYELCCSLTNKGAGHWSDPDHQAMLAIAAQDVAQLCLAYSIPIRRLTPAQVRAGERGICGHVDMRDAFPGSTTHWDPGPHFPWNQFLGMVLAAADALVDPPKPPLTPPVQPPKPGTYAALMLAAAKSLRAARARATRDGDAATAGVILPALERLKRIPGWVDTGESGHAPSSIPVTTHIAAADKALRGARLRNPLRWGSVSAVIADLAR